MSILDVLVQVQSPAFAAQGLTSRLHSRPREDRSRDLANLLKSADRGSMEKANFALERFLRDPHGEDREALDQDAISMNAILSRLGRERLRDILRKGPIPRSRSGRDARSAMRILARERGTANRRYGRAWRLLHPRTTPPRSMLRSRAVERRRRRMERSRRRGRFQSFEDYFEDNF